ncbi:hypothetical protein BDQ17DRAFT_1350897 [Cyathus striatus]|nr:hypothetical protein BDQ17DRAFT_1350897 [Cyathus striatus]
MHRLGSSSRSLKASCSSVFDTRASIQSLSKLHVTRFTSQAAAQPRDVSSDHTSSRPEKKSQREKGNFSQTLSKKSGKRKTHSSPSSTKEIGDAFSQTSVLNSDVARGKNTGMLPRGPKRALDDGVEFKLAPGTIWNGRPRLAMLLSTGEIFKGLRSDVVFAIPSIASATLATRCGDDESSPSVIEINARVEVLRRIREIIRQVEERYRHVSKKGVGLYDRLRSDDPHEWSSVTLSEVARLIDPKPDLLTIFATHQMLAQKSKYFKFHRDYLVCQEFLVRPLAEVEIFDKVAQWNRLPVGTGPIDSFALKARQASHDDDIPTQAPALHTWSDTDKDIIQFLTHSIRPFRTNQDSPYALARSTITRRVLPSVPEASIDVIYRLLVDIGVFAPWQDNTKDDIVHRGLSTPPSTKVLGPEDFYPADPLETIRHDFGDLPVYVIDDVTAEELDDGISVERIPSEPGSFWIHVHIADPGSLLHPGHKLAQHAQKQGQTIYFMQRSYPLFPKSIMHHTSRGLSLGSGKVHSLPERVMTFSSKVNARGHIIDYRVRAGIVNNVHVLSYDQVDSHLFGKVSKSSYPSKQAEDLQLLHQITRSIINERLITRISFAIQIPHDIVSPTLQPSVFKGFPGLTYESKPFYWRFGSRAMIAESAKLACRVASRYGVEHNLPLLRLHFHKIVDLIAANPTSEYTTEPRAHPVMQIPEGEGYSRVTSPLRPPSSKPPFSLEYMEDFGVALKLQETRNTYAERENALFFSVLYIDRWMQETARLKAQGKEREHDPLRDLEGVAVMNNKVNLRDGGLQHRVWIPSLGLHAMLMTARGSREIGLGTSVPIEIVKVEYCPSPAVYVALR